MTNPPTPPYTEATVVLVAAALAAGRDDDVFVNPRRVGEHWDGSRDIYRSDARDALNALVKAGLLLPDGAETRTEHEIEWRRVGQTRGGVQQITHWDLDEAALVKEVIAAAGFGRELVSHRWREVRTWGTPAYLSDGPRYVGPWVDAATPAEGGGEADQSKDLP